MSLEIGTQVGDYQILGSIGAGAYGEVFRAEHLITHRVDALKMLSDRVPGASEQSQQFIREIQLQASLSHPNIAAVHNAFWTGDGLALVMELVRGEPLSAILRRGRVPLVPGISYMLGALSALAYAHSQGIVHRDIKPENIVVGPDGAVKLTDFGLAQSPSGPGLTECGEFAGTPSYMSPEQVLATGEIGAPSDIYSTGVVLYEIVTGRLPFPGDSPFEVMLSHQSAPPVPPGRIVPGIPPELDQVILTALQKDPDRRFRTATEFQIALHQAGMLAVPGNKRHGLALAGTAALAIAGAIALWFAPHHHTAAASATRPQPAVSAPPAEPMAAVPEPVKVEIPRPRPRKKRALRAAQPPSLLPLFTSSAADPEPKPALTPAPPVPSSAPPEAEVELPAAIAVKPPEAAAPPADFSAAPPKRRNPLVRALGKIFHGKKAEPPKQ